MRSPSSTELSRARPLLGTRVRMRVSGLAPAALASAVETAFREVARVHALMSFHSPESEVSRLNRAAAHAAVRVSEETFSVLAIAHRLSEASGGLFDITVAPSLVRWGFLPPVSRGGGYGPRLRGTWRDVELLAPGVVRFRRPLLVDLGGIAKGFAVDLAVDALRAAGVPCGVVDAGGDLRAFGDREEPVHVRLPRAPGEVVRLTTLLEAAFATSSACFTRAWWRGQAVSPLVHPRELRPWLGHASVSVKAPSCVVADGLTKILLLGGRDALPILRAFSADGFLVRGRGDVLTSEASPAA